MNTRSFLHESKKKPKKKQKLINTGLPHTKGTQEIKEILILFLTHCYGFLFIELKFKLDLYVTRLIVIIKCFFLRFTYRIISFKFCCPNKNVIEMTIIDFMLS